MEPVLLEPASSVLLQATLIGIESQKTVTLLLSNPGLLPVLWSFSPSSVTSLTSSSSSWLHPSSTSGSIQPGRTSTITLRVSYYAREREYYEDNPTFFHHQQSLCTQLLHLGGGLVQCKQLQRDVHSAAVDTVPDNAGVCGVRVW
eukprot:jgi/Chlat1/3163/Chrsp219S03306